MFKIGVVGPGQSVERIIAIAKEFDEGMNFIPYIYTETKETEQIVLENDQHVDHWLFSGPLPYLIAKNVLDDDKRMEHIYPTEASIYKGFLEVVYAQKKLVERVSIDMLLSTKFMEESLRSSNLSISELYMKTFEATIDPNELLEFHLALWNQKKTDAAMTCYPTVYQSLVDAGIPAYWISPSNMDIHQTVRVFVEKVRTSYFKDTQIGIEMIEVEQFDRIKESAKTPYHLQYLELRIKEALIKLCEQVDGSLLEQGNGRYVIFSTRGTIHREIPTLQSTVELLAKEADTTVAVGIGFGETAFAAEMNAHRALRQSKEKAARDIVMIQDDGTIVEWVGQEEELIYSYRADDDEVLEKLKKGNISVKSYKKLDALLQKMGWTDFTTKDLAKYLQMSERNAQRIVADLCAVELAECSGEESQSTRGRPTKRYRLL
ncbi:hypothetical protein [Brevibacillus sp. 179-C 1.1 NHS]|uniref:hypothetical protein n=1 Tax=Brevibacillus sp. 179-C 1.1 NHS TaxID=3235177 RepID=UPI0039A0777A